MTFKAITQTSNLLFNPPAYLKQHVEAFTQELLNNGYFETTIETYRSCISHFGAWLNKENISLECITDKLVLQFGKHTCHCCLDSHRKKQFSRQYLNRIYRFIDYLSQKKIIAIESPAQKTPPIYLADFRKSLQERGLAVKTVERYEYELRGLIALLGDVPNKYDATTIHQVICDAAMHNSRAVVKKSSTVLRTYLRFLSMNGHPSVPATVRQK